MSMLSDDSDAVSLRKPGEESLMTYWRDHLSSGNQKRFLARSDQAGKGHLNAAIIYARADFVNVHGKSSWVAVIADYFKKAAYDY